MDITDIKYELDFLVRNFDDYDVKGYLADLVRDIERQEEKAND